MKPRTIRRFVSAVVLLLATGAYLSFSTPPATADIYRWDNGNLITTLDAEPDADLRGLDLSYADLAGKDLRNVIFNRTSNLTSADFTGAVISGARFPHATDYGFTAEQFYSTASYQNGVLRGVDLQYDDLTGWDFAGKNLQYASFNVATLTSANFAEANLTSAGLFDATLSSADFAGALITHTNFWNTTSRGFTAEQFYSTASYRSGQLAGSKLGENDLSGWDFAGANLADTNFQDADLTSADFAGADLTNVYFKRTTLTSADFAGAVIAGADFESVTGLTAEQFYSTVTYQNDQLRGIDLSRTDLSGWNFAGMNLTDVSFHKAALDGTDFSGADLTGVDFTGALLPLYLSVLPVIPHDYDSVVIAHPAFVTDSIVIDSGGYLRIRPVYTLECDVILQLDASGSGVIYTEKGVVLDSDSTLQLIATGASPFKAGTYTLIDPQQPGGVIDGTFGSFSGLGGYATEDDLVYTETTLTLQIDTDLLPADANLDIQTDLSDFNIWNANKFTADTGWTTGDFNGDGVTDLSDFNIWNAHKFTTATGGAAPAPVEVPEPGTLGLLILATAIAFACRHRRH